MRKKEKRPEQPISELKPTDKLPAFRPDIKIIQGPDEPDGSPTYNLYDPIRALYYKVGWAEMFIINLLKPNMTLEELMKAIRSSSNMNITEEGVRSFFADADRHNLLVVYRSAHRLEEQVEARKVHPLLWLIYHYLYFRIPLVHPNAFFSRTIQYIKPLFSSYALAVYAIVVVLGFVFLFTRFSQFVSTFTYFFNWQGLVMYACAIIFIKIMHELAHAYTAKYFGVNVPTVGVVFIVLWPVLYTDVTDSWKLSKRYQRLAISSAGVSIELFLAGLSTFGWALTSPGILQSIFYVVASTTWVTTLILNLNPAMRFDGYYLASDLVGVDNLQPRAFGYTRWAFHKWLFGVNRPCPEHLSLKVRVFLVIYTIYTCAYRLFIYTVVAFFVYHLVTKELGILLFAIEIVFFILWPIVYEIQYLYYLRRMIHFNKRLLVASICVAAFLFWFIVPLPHNLYFPAVVISPKEQTVYIPYDSVIAGVYIKKNEEVKPNQTLLTLSSVSLEHDISEATLDQGIVQNELLTATLNAEVRSYIQSKKDELAADHDELARLLQLKDKLTVKSNIEGTVYEWDQKLAENQSVKKGQVVGKIANLSKLSVICFVPETDLPDIKKGQSITFRSTTMEEIPGIISDISPSRQVSLAYPQLASINKGELAVVSRAEAGESVLLLVESYYRAEVTLTNYKKPLHIGETGTVQAVSPPTSKLVTLLRYLRSLLTQESNP